VRAWWKRACATRGVWRDGPALESDLPDGDANADAVADAGEYQLLYKYLRERYANRVVLTFAEIEDLLGFALPGPARLHREWWGSGKQSDSWTLARRTATVNLLAQTAIFDREFSTVAMRPVTT
jgi:hypothetical protein